MRKPAILDTKTYTFLTMKLFATISFFIMSIALSANAQNTPLIDREIFFGNPEISGGKLSPDGQHVSFLKAHNGIMNIFVKKFDEPFDKAQRLTDLERPSAGYFWTDDSKFIVYAKDKGGNENYNIYAVSPTAAPDASTGVPASRNLTPNENVRVQIFMVSKKDPDVMMIGLNDRDEKWHDLYKLEISSGKLTKLSENTNRIGGWIFDWNEKPRLALRNPEDGSTEFLSVEGDQFTKIYECGPLESAYPIAFSKDNAKVYVQTNKGAEVNLTKLVLMDPKTGAATDVEQDPEKRVDLGGAQFSDVTKELIWTSYTDEKDRYYFKDKNWEADFKFLKSKFPGKEVAFSGSTKDEQKILVAIYSDRAPSEVYFFDRKTKQVAHQYTPRPKLKPYEDALAPMTPIRYKSSDGLEIPAYLTLPKGTTGKNLPLLVVPHGGPWARDHWGFNSLAQLMANRGFAVLQPNFRGSTGYGKKFLDAGNLEWGKLMQDDITWGVKHLIAEGIADAKKVAIMGGSYGGYATLAGLAFTPDLYACGVDIVGPSNLFTLLSTIPPYWEAGRKIFTLRMGDESTEEGKKILTEASPLFSASKITSPLMIVQGANDPRVKKPESDQIVVALRDLGHPVEYILAEDEGHGFAKPDNNMAMYAAAEKFLAKYCGTRYQESMPDNVAERLKAMTVDISTVSVAKTESLEVPKELTLAASPLTAGTSEYTVTIAVSGQTIPMSKTRTITEDGGQWVITEESKSPMGSATDKAIYAKSGLAPISRSTAQGPVKIEVLSDEKDISLDLNMNGQSQKATLTPDGAWISDAPGQDLIIARLPLKAGFKMAYYAPDLMTMKLKKYHLMVVGHETVAGKETVKVEVTNSEDPADKSVLWIDPAASVAVKTEQVMPAMGGAKITTELK